MSGSDFIDEVTRDMTLSYFQPTEKDLRDDKVMAELDIMTAHISAGGCSFGRYNPFRSSYPKEKILEVAMVFAERPMGRSPLIPAKRPTEPQYVSGIFLQAEAWTMFDAPMDDPRGYGQFRWYVLMLCPHTRIGVELANSVPLTYESARDEGMMSRLFDVLLGNADKTIENYARTAKEIRNES